MDNYSDDEILQMIRHRRATCDAYWRINYDDRYEQYRFAMDSNSQWSYILRRSGETSIGTRLTVNRILPAIKQVVNDLKQNSISIKISPVNEGNDPKQAEILQGLCRHIEARSNSDVSVNTAFEHMVTHGLGFTRVITEYEGEDSFNQEIRIVRIINPFSVFFDPASIELDFSDAQYCFIQTPMDKKEFSKQYPDSACVSDGFEGISSSGGLWANADSIMLCEFFYIVEEQTKLHLLKDGSTVYADDLKQYGEMFTDIVIVKSRDVTRKKVKWCLSNGVEILDKKDWIGSYIPVIAYVGQETYIEGKREFFGMTKDAMDIQAAYNYYLSIQTEQLGMSTLAPWVASARSIKGYEKAWNSANTVRYGVLLYNDVDPEHSQMPPPQMPHKVSYEPAIQAIAQTIGMLEDSIKAVTQIYDSALGNRSRETSGVAIDKRVSQSMLGNSNYIKNVTVAERHKANILLDLIPRIYDTPTVKRIIGEDGVEEVVKINQEFIESNKVKLIDLNAGRYDVIVTSGKSYTTRREETRDNLMQLLQALPQIGQVAPDILLKQFDFSGVDEIVKRLQAAIPGLKDDKGQEDIPPQVQAQLQQLQQQAQQLQEQLQAAQQQLQAGAVEAQSKERIEMAQIESKERIEAAKLKKEYDFKELDLRVAQQQQQIEAEEQETMQMLGNNNVEQEQNGGLNE